MIWLKLWMFVMSTYSWGATVLVQDEAGHPVSGAMVSAVKIPRSIRDVSDNGYAKPGVANRIEPEHTIFTDSLGKVQIPSGQGSFMIRIRKLGYVDIGADAVKGDQKFVLKKIKDPTERAAQLSANVWLGALNVGTPEDKVHFKMQCGFCHQQGAFFTRQERSIADWNAVIKRMVRYGSRIPSDLQKTLPVQLQQEYKKLRDNPTLLQPPSANESLSEVSIREWPVGDGMSQVHDVLVHTNGKIYAADNIQDRLYELDSRTNEITVFKIPHKESDSPGGLIAGRLRDFPKHDSTSNAHSLAQSKVDGHIFITPSAQKRLIEFDPKNRTFLIHEIGGGFYPHTIRVDARDQVWFTLALSNQIGVFDREKKSFKLYDLPTRSLKEKLVVRFMPEIFKLMSWGIPLSNWLPIDRQASGTPLPYGIDITPDGKVWFARLHTDEIGVIDPLTSQVQMFSTPFRGPRRLRADQEGNLWIVAFGDSALVKYDPKTNQFEKFELPVSPVGSETPYSLMVDPHRPNVWVTGNQSDSVFLFDRVKKTWKQIPLPKKGTFTRDFDLAEDGSVYTSNSHFPSWQIEGAQPTLIQIQVQRSGLKP